MPPKFKVIALGEIHPNYICIYDKNSVSTKGVSTVYSVEQCEGYTSIVTSVCIVTVPVVIEIEC